MASLDPSNIVPSGARYRRTEHSSFDVSDAGEFLVSNVKFRVAAPPARPLPIQTVVGHASCTLVRKVLGRTLQDGVADVTVLTVAPWDERSPTVWESAVKEAKRFVDAKTRASKELQHLDIAVEMIAEELTRLKYVSHIPAEEWTPSLPADWERIKDKVPEILNSHPATRGTTTSISLFKFGFSRDGARNPLTVYISVDYESEEAGWASVISEIEQYLDTYPYNLHVHIEHGGPEFFGGLYD
ncbi:hypothetical protein C8A03DRAFT_13838 [Achaetomium macrosporum]|uniref:Uncharacterized protein n=1 Tax=Achaetomium macrosporum TaxID=79813 RepID=A0AAN7CD10_9PEZI|nr:hypothetical protein C8A03DRAFT_13838 [Achaetomium macrosporum]